MRNSYKVKFGFLLLIFVCLEISCDKMETFEEPDLSTGWSVFFEEEFEQDFSKWFLWDAGAFNQEIQLYQSSQAELVDGQLKIDTRRQNISGPTNIYDGTIKQFEYVSARLESKELFSPSASLGDSEYWFEARIKLPEGHGMWPAFWTYGDPWPTRGEIDILEFRGGERMKYLSNIFYGRQANVNINKNNDKYHSFDFDLTQDFHTYGMIWRDESIDILFDNKIMYRYENNGDNNISEFFNKNQKIVLNTAVGGLFFSDKNSSNYADSSTMYVDWVRVHKR